MNRTLSFCILVVLLSGCAKIAHLPQLLTLKAYSQDKDMQEEYVKEQDRKFEKLVKVVKSDSLGQYPDKKSFLKEFGDPVFSKTVNREDGAYDLWLYRYAVQFSDPEKVYLYFDGDEKLHDWEYVAAKEKME